MDPGESVQVAPRRTRQVLPSVLILLAGALLALLPHLRLAGSVGVAIAQAVLPALCLGALVLCLILYLRRAFGRATILLLLTAVALAPLLFPLPERSITPATATQVSILSLNAGRGQADVKVLAEIIAATNPSVLVLVETSEPMLQRLASLMPDEAYPHRTGNVVFGGSVDTVILSKFALRQEADAVKQSDGALFDAPVALIHYPGIGEIRVAGIHPVPPTHGHESWESTLASIDTWQQRQDRTPLILAGDFNATRGHPQFRKLARGFLDASPTMGPLAAGTWPADASFPAFAGIDHVLVKGFGVDSSELIKISGTDHHGIMAQLVPRR